MQHGGTFCHDFWLPIESSFSWRNGLARTCELQVGNLGSSDSSDTKELRAFSTRA